MINVPNMKSDVVMSLEVVKFLTILKLNYAGGNTKSVSKQDVNIKYSANIT